MLDDACVADAVALAEGIRPRTLLGLAGPPGAGKSTLAKELVAGVNRRLGADSAAYVPLDGFHLSNAQLQRVDRLLRKGAPDTFDVWGYLALLRRLRAEVHQPVYAPDFDRVLDEPIAARLEVPPGTCLIVTEGNYLASDAPGWVEVRRLVEGLWYVEADDSVRERRLLERQRAAGRDPEEAREWVTRSDGPNGELVKATRSNCSHVLTGL